MGLGDPSWDSNGWSCVALRCQILVVTEITVSDFVRALEEPERCAMLVHGASHT